MNVYDSMKKGVQEAIDHEKGTVKARSAKLTIEPVPDIEAQDIKQIRVALGMTQVLFAGLMGVSIKTVEAWEAGRNIPDGPARRMLGMIQSDPQLPEKFHLIAR